MLWVEQWQRTLRGFKRTINKDKEIMQAATLRTRTHQRSSSARKRWFSGTFTARSFGRRHSSQGQSARTERQCHFVRLGDRLRPALEEPFVEHLADAEAGSWDGFQAGFPRTTFRRQDGKRCPAAVSVRSKEFPYDVPGQQHRRQAEADRGTIRAAAECSS